jgi:predicted SAM-dependent methyltransferase
MKSSESFARPTGHAPLHQVQNSWSPYAKTSASMRRRLRSLWARLGFNHDVASKLRYELDMALLRIRCSLSPKYGRQIRELSRRRELLVHLGCGNAVLPGWINLDCYPPSAVGNAEMLTLDMRRGLPFADGSVEALFSEHFLEHLPLDTVRSTILPNVRRIMSPGGKIRLGVPNGEYFVDQYVAYRAGKRDTLFDAQLSGKTPMMMLNEIAHGYGHHFAYDFETLAGLLAAAGFVNVRKCAALETSVEHFRAKDRVDEWRKAMTLYVEAEAPQRSP